MYVRSPSLESRLARDFTSPELNNQNTSGLFQAASFKWSILYLNIVPMNPKEETFQISKEPLYGTPVSPVFQSAPAQSRDMGDPHLLRSRRDLFFDFLCPLSFYPLSPMICGANCPLRSTFNASALLLKLERWRRRRRRSYTQSMVYCARLLWNSVPYIYFTHPFGYILQYEFAKGILIWCTYLVRIERAWEAGMLGV